MKTMVSSRRGQVTRLPIPTMWNRFSAGALDVGSRTDVGGVAYVQLLLDGNIISDTNSGSFYWDPAEWDFNYFGHERMDVHELYVDVPVSKHSGYAFLMDIGYLILARGYSQGLHLLKVRAGDWENNVTDIAQVPVIFDCDDDGDDPALGEIMTPTHMEMTGGVVEVSGFADDNERIESVETRVDGVYIGDADIRLDLWEDESGDATPGSRPRPYATKAISTSSTPSRRSSQMANTASSYGPEDVSNGRSI